MLGAITGDTVGSAYEFHNTKEYNFTLFLGNSAYTDDSVMTMAVAYWLLKDKEHSYPGLNISSRTNMICGSRIRGTRRPPGKP